jgi:alkylation response protein AidB-like acyl-CoA dehydrogenase
MPRLQRRQAFSRGSIHGRELLAQRTAQFESELRAAGRIVKRYTAVAASISRGGIYPRLTARSMLVPEKRIELVTMKATQPTARRPRPR